MRAAEQVLDVEVEILRCVAGVVRSIGKARDHAGSCMLIARRVVAASSIELIAATAAFENVIAAIAVHYVNESAAPQILDPDVRVPLSITPAVVVGIGA
jgi:hypothetical protein